MILNNGGKHNNGNCRRQDDSDPTILIVDDDPRVVSLLREFLEEEGFSVSYAGNGQNALYAIERNPPDVVLADIRMPVMDGMTLLREITNRWDEIDVIMMSATESPAGLDVPFIQKPFDLNEVYTTICSCHSSS